MCIFCVWKSKRGWYDVLHRQEWLYRVCFQRHHRWWGLCGWAEGDFALLCSCVGPSNPEGEKFDCVEVKTLDADWLVLSYYSIFFFLPQVDVASVITHKLLKVSMKHIEIISTARQKGVAHMHKPLFIFLNQENQSKDLSFCSVVKNTEHLQQAALEEYGPDLHVALRSRRDELLYLRKLTEMLFPYILPPKATDCR